MRKACVAFLGLALIGIGLASCGRFQGAQRPAWRDEAESACLARGEVRNSAYMSLRSTPIAGPGICGMNKPVRVNAFMGGSVAVTNTQTLACPIIPATDRFLAQVVQPAAMGVLGTQVIEMKAGSYSCRSMNNGSGTSRRSEHAFGNALDIFAFRTSDGREISVRNGWNGSPEEQAFLREVFVGACEIYKTVLGPGADMFHYDHFHVDLARHNGGRHVCRPVIKFTPRRDLQPPDPARSWTALNAERQAPFRAAPRAPAAALAGSPAVRVPSTEPQVGGPVRLPGYVQGAEEVVVGDVEGEMVDPDNDPFALEDPVKRPAAPQARQSVPIPQQSYTPRPAAPQQFAPQRLAPQQLSPQQLAPQQLSPPPQRAAPAREWPPRF